MLLLHRKSGQMNKERLVSLEVLESCVLQGVHMNVCVCGGGDKLDFDRIDDWNQASAGRYS